MTWESKTLRILAPTMAPETVAIGDGDRFMIGRRGFARFFPGYGWCRSITNSGGPIAYISIAVSYDEAARFCVEGWRGN